MTTTRRCCFIYHIPGEPCAHEAQSLAGLIRRLWAALRGRGR